MFDTNIIVIGNVLTIPEWRRTANSGTLVANFRVASTSRRIDRETGKWTDGNQLRVRVTCWRRLAEGVATSITVGDPVVVTGRLYTRDWTDSEGTLRTTYEMDAVAVGHDLARGKGRFFRAKAQVASAEVPEAADRVRGESAPVVPADEVPAGYGDGIPECDEPVFEEQPAGSRGGAESLPVLPGGGLEPFEKSLAPVAETPAVPETEEAGEPSEEGTGDEPGPIEVPGEPEPEAPRGEIVTVVTPRRTRNRTPRRLPVAA